MPLDWVNTLFLGTSHALALAAIAYMVFVQFSWWTVGLAFLWMMLSGVSVTGGYHRLFSHRAYSANWLLRAFYLLFGAAAVQNSALKWSVDHRLHHSRTDQTEDPYNIRRGFWWAHIGWVLHRGDGTLEASAAPDLAADPLVRFQHKYYVLIALFVGALAPAALGLLWGDPIGALLVVGFLRLVLLWHATFSVNSFAHYLGSRPYSKKTSARDSFFTALITLGEGYHNFHHRFQADYRNGVRWYHFDPTKWFVWTLSHVRITRDLRRVPQHAIDKARRMVLEERGQRVA